MSGFLVGGHLLTLGSSPALIPSPAVELCRARCATLHRDYGPGTDFMPTRRGQAVFTLKQPLQKWRLRWHLRSLPR